jgi:hypothetical protein
MLNLTKPLSTRKESIRRRDLSEERLLPLLLLEDLQANNLQKLTL